MKNKIVFAFFLCAPLYSAAQKLPYKDRNLPVVQRVDDLMSRMSVAEKIEQLCMKSLNQLDTTPKGQITPQSLEKLFAGSSIGCLESPFIEHSAIARYSQAADHYLRTKTRLGIPAIQIAECIHGQMALGATIFPQAISQGTTWNPQLIEQMASAIALEASLAGVDQALSPVFDLARDPRYGRVEESYSEDPYLVAQMGMAYVKGMQGNPKTTADRIEEGKLMCTAKHFIAYSIPQAGINIAPVHVGERTMRELHLYPFEKVVKEANIYSLMPGYHEVDGVPVHANKWLLDTVLRQEWGFKGYVFSDYGAIPMMNYFHQTTASEDESGILALESGVDLEAPSKSAFANLEQMVEQGKISIEVIDRAVARILTAKFRAGLFDRPYKINKNSHNLIHTPEHIQLARQIANESVVLLKNSNNILPLDTKKIKSVAVIGPNADRVQFGDYSITKNNDYGVTTLAGMKNIFPKEVKINYAEGCGITNLSKEGFGEAVEAAKNSDVVVLVVGGTSIIYSGIGWGDQNSKEVNTCGEGFDRNELGLPGVQSELFEAIAQTGKPIIMVMVNGRAMTVGNEIEASAAALEAWYGGEQAGMAIADILLGNVNPSGKLTVTFPKTTGHIPINYDYKPSSRGFYKQPGTPEKPGRDYVFSSPEPLFPFGFGLSYTSFEYSDLKIENNLNQQSKNIIVTFNLKNSGSYDGAEVAQLYVRDCISSVTTPVKALKAFKKVFLKAGQSSVVTLEIAMEDLMLWNRNMKRVIEPGDFEIMVGASSEDIRLKNKFTYVIQ